MNIIFQAITNIISNKEASGIHPTIALSIEVARLTGMAPQEVEKEVEALKSEGLIRIGRTLNYSYYELQHETY